ncbi:MAG TPA: carboxy terminal-processing peptidase [Spirochaetota bacterium]|mgnify:CR=1 FL=1|nr:carboxy terminal-processing peptidase [Spirochaetota bacterium]HPG52419.1 carboxy terminal-processing peptidase [Spirochaetota bacterium]HPN13172.1 carboxy terminal-processing peptidase [Spirochaetota bacterium]
MSKKRLISLLTLVIILSCFKNSQGLKKAEVPALVNQFLAMHVRYHQLDDELSARILDNFILSLDYGKYYFYKKDIDRFAAYRTKIDDYIRNNQLDFMEDIYSVYRQRYIESNKMVGELLKSKFDFTADEKMVVDREKVDFAGTKEEMRERWRKSIKLQLLNYISADQSLAEAKKKLAKKYELMNKRVEEINEEKLLDRFMNAFSTALDPHSNYLTQDENEDFSISMKLKLEGIGVRLKSEDGFVIVESIIVGGAADKLPEKIKLKPGDKIIAVSQSDGEAFDVIDMDLRDVVKKIRGAKGTEVRLTVLRKGGEDNKAIRMIVPIVREEISLKDSDAESEIFYLDKEKKNKIGYIKLPSFYYDRESGKSSSGDVRDILGRLKTEGVRCIVLDLRGNPGGLLNEAVDIAGYFIDSGPVLQIVDGRNYPHVVSDNDENIVYSGPIVVLIDKFSASASEILAGAIKDYNRGLIVGPESTFGKGTVQTYNELPQKKGAVKITISIFYQPSGTSNQLTGIAPDIKVPDMTLIWDIGESKSRFPLSWEKIEPAPHKDYAMVTPGMISQLSGISTARINGNEKYRKLIEKIRNYREQVNSKTISLKEESSIEKQKQKEMEKTLNKREGKKLIDLENDLFLGEAFRITGDYINKLGK